MRFLHLILQRDKLNLLALLLLITASSLFLLGCGGSSSPSTVVSTEDIERQSTIDQRVSFLGKNYTLVALDEYESSGLQAYWPSDNDMPVSVQVSLQLLLPQINKLFIKHAFSFSYIPEGATSPDYKKIFFRAKTIVIDESQHNDLSVTFTEDGSLSVALDIDKPLATSVLSSQLIQSIYQSERYKYRHDDSILEQLVSRGLALHFLQNALPESELMLAVDIEPSALSLALSQVEAGLADEILIDNWFTGKSLNEQLTVNAVGYYLVTQHFSFYSGSDASNSFSVDSELFLPWLIGGNDSIKKAQQYVRTGDVPEQIAVNELSRQANLFGGHYFIEGLNHEKLIALSFDDGPSQYTTQILDVLDHAKVPASFFWQGKNLAEYQTVIERSIAAGHTVANHSWNHANGMRYSADELWQNQVVKTNDEFQQLFNIIPRFYRPPYGEISDAQVEFLAEKGMKVLLWSVDSRDWNPNLNSVAQIEKELINNQHEEVITLMHDAGGNRQNTVDALPAIIEHYQGKGYRFVNLETLLGISDKH